MFFVFDVQIWQFLLRSEKYREILPPAMRNKINIRSAIKVRLELPTPRTNRFANLFIPFYMSAFNKL